MLNSLRRALARFAADESASLVAEAVLILPVLAWWYVGSLTFFQAYQARNTNVKAAYTISDMLSRENGSVNAAYLDGLTDVFRYLTAGAGNNPAVRITMMKCTQNCADEDPGRVLGMDWSYATGGRRTLTGDDLPSYQSKIPLTPLGDRVIVVETFMTYTPSFNVGLTQSSFQNIVVTRPRFVPVLCFDGIACSAS